MSTEAERRAVWHPDLPKDDPGGANTRAKEKDAGPCRQTAGSLLALEINGLQHRLAELIALRDVVSKVPYDSPLESAIYSLLMRRDRVVSGYSTPTIHGTW